MRLYRRGDTISFDMINFNGQRCPAATPIYGFTARCNLPNDHTGPHLAIGVDLVILEAWE
ncbi:MAG TPA: hypothetical protein VIG71_10865 [Enteractinococcus sp.]